jgi:hypothetical protein
MTSYIVTLAVGDVPALEQALTERGLRIAHRQTDGARGIVVVEDVSMDALAAIRTRVPESRWTRDFL